VLLNEHDLPFSQNQLLKLARDQKIQILKNKINTWDVSVAIRKKQD